MIEAVAGLIKYEDKYLIGKRTNGDGPAIGKWEFPGGKIEVGETDQEAIRREIKEEFGIDVSVRDYLCDYTQVYPNRSIHLKLYLCIVNNPEIINMNEEHTDFVLTSFEDIATYELAPADVELYKKINKNLFLEEE